MSVAPAYLISVTLVPRGSSLILLASSLMSIWKLSKVTDATLLPSASHLDLVDYIGLGIDPHQLDTGACLCHLGASLYHIIGETVDGLLPQECAAQKVLRIHGEKLVEIQCPKVEP